VRTRSNLQMAYVDVARTEARRQDEAAPEAAASPNQSGQPSNKRTQSATKPDPSAPTSPTDPRQNAKKFTKLRPLARSLRAVYSLAADLPPLRAAGRARANAVLSSRFAHCMFPAGTGSR